MTPDYNSIEGLRDAETISMKASMSCAKAFRVVEVSKSGACGLCVFLMFREGAWKK